MRQGHCRELDQGLRDPRWAVDPDGLMTWLQGLTGVQDCIGGGLRRASASEDWLTFERYVLGAHEHPSRIFTPKLCEVLGRQIDEINNEDIVDVLAEIADSAAVGCLEKALWWQPPWDEYRQLAVKCVWALAAIGTDDALKVLREATSCAAAPVREAAHASWGTPMPDRGTQVAPTTARRVPESS